MNNLRVWVFRFFVLCVIGVMVMAYILPWWVCNIAEIFIENQVVIHAYGLSNNLGSSFAGYFSGSEMPAFFTPLMWTFLGVTIILSLLSLFVKDKEIRIWKIHTSLSSFIMGFVGLAWIVVVLIGLIVMAVRTGDFYGIHLNGTTFISLGHPKEGNAVASLQLGYYLACAVGPLCLILAILRNKIIGNKA
jgi:hypothetical protein